MKKEQCDGMIYRTAVYLRLSREDGDLLLQGRDQSGSIRSQREQILSYMETEEDLELFDIYADDGYSGMDFDRPEFLRMMEDIRKERVNCVIVRDLSRLGRDYIEVGKLLQRIFPAFSVRFVALADHYDSQNAAEEEQTLLLPVRSFVNDAYCRDISCKVRSQQKIRRMQGDFIGAFCPYGYRKDENDRHRLVPDAVPAFVVQKIFHWKLSGCSNGAIARLLNELGILSPAEYKWKQGQHFACGFASGRQAKWSAAAVKRILVNEVYLGNMIQGKEEKLSYKLKAIRKKPKEEWICVRQTHKPLIREEDFRLASQLLHVKLHAEKGGCQAYKYSGILFCGDCGRPMIRRLIRGKKETGTAYICAGANRQEGCRRHRIRETELDALLIRQVCRYDAFLQQMTEELCRCDNDALEEEVQFWKKQMAESGRQNWKMREQKRTVIRDMRQGKLSTQQAEQFLERLQEAEQQNEQIHKRQQVWCKRLEKERDQTRQRLDSWKKTGWKPAADRLFLLAFVKRIEVREGRELMVIFYGKETEWNGTKTDAGKPDGKQTGK